MQLSSRGVSLLIVLVSGAMALISAVPISSAFATEFGSDVRVNHIIVGDQETQESGAIAVYGENVYAVWSDTDTQAVYVSRSTDGGLTFDDGVAVAETAGQFFPAIAVDNQGAVYAAWTLMDSEEMFSGIVIAKSVDGGATFSPPVMVSLTGAFPQVATDGDNVYILYVGSEDFVTLNFYFTRSLDRGATFQPAYMVNDAVPHDARIEDMSDIFVDDAGVIYAAWNDGRGEDSGVNIYLASSTDHGASFGPNVPVNDITGATADNMHFGPAIAASGSMVYVVWRDETVEDIRRVMFAKSSDGGATFGPAIQPHETLTYSPDIALDSDGDIYVVAPSGMGINCVRSTDHGESFTQDAMISSDQSYDSKNPSIAMGADDVLFAVWTDMRTGTKDIYAASGTMITTAVEDRAEYPAPAMIAYGNHPNPFNAQTTIRYELPLPSAVRITVFNALGQTVATRDLGECAPGMHEYRFDASSLTSGMYVYQVETRYGRVSGRMLYLK